MKNVQVIKPTKLTHEEGQHSEKNKKIVSPYVRVSTDKDDQMNSYESQIKYYTNKIKNNPEWILGDIYTDGGISGTQTKKRDDFKRMIMDALNGDIDMIITKSIARFARNTEDTLKYVRRLKEYGVGVIFEKENINTLDMDSEVILTILSSLAQEESVSISKNVKMGIKMKMQRGEIIGMPRCLGYDYIPETKQLKINQQEAEIVRYIFKRYIEGAGGYVIAKELTNNPHAYTIRGNKKWDATSVLNIIKNEKYKGDLLQGKTITTNPITKRKIKNMGEEPQYLVEGHHEPIIDEEVFNKAQEILSKRSKNTKTNMKNRTKYSRKHAFSSITRCGYCNGRTTRRRWHKGKPYEKFVWQCANYLKGKERCPESKGVDEKLLQEAFIQTFNKLQSNNMSVIKEFIQNFTEKMQNSDYSKEINKINKKINKLEEQSARLVDMRLENIIDEYVYKEKYEKISNDLEVYRKAKDELKNINANEEVVKVRTKELTKILTKEDKVLTEFDRDIFDKIVDEVIIGGYDENNIFDPYMIIFRLKSGIVYANEILFNDKKTGGKNSYANHEVNTSSINNKDTSLTFDFIYNFGYSIYKNSLIRNGEHSITIKIII